MPFLTSEQITALSPEEHKIYGELMQRTAEYAREPYRQAEPPTVVRGRPELSTPGRAAYNPAYPGQRMANTPQEIQDAQSFIDRDFGAENGMFHRSENTIRNNIQPFHENYRAYMNPYQDAVLRQLSEEGSRNFNENIMPSLDARFMRLGQFGSTRHADLGLRAARDFQKELLARQQQALSSGYEKSADIYNANQGRGLEGAAQLSNLATTKQASRMGDVGALEGVGRYKQQQEQSILDAQYQEYLRQLDEPMRRLQAQAGIMHGLPSTGSIQQYRETPATPQTAIPSNLSTIASGLLAARMFGNRG